MFWKNAFPSGRRLRNGARPGRLDLTAHLRRDVGLDPLPERVQARLMTIW